MAKKRRKKKADDSLKTWLLSLIPAVIGIVLYIVSGKYPAFAEWYARKLYPAWIYIVGHISSLWPMSLLETLFEAMILLILFFILRDIVRLCLKRHSRKHWLLHWLRILILSAGCIAAVFMIGGGINYNRKPFSEVAGFSIEKSSSEELYALCRLMVNGLYETVDEVPRDYAGRNVMLDDFKLQAVTAMEKLADDYDCLKGYYPLPNRILWSDFLSYQNITGVFSPWTAEANYNGAIVPYNLPHTACHELSHLRGFMREDEANFVSYLACIGSDDVNFRYSGYMLGYIYASNALSNEDYDLWLEVRSSIPDKCRLDLDHNSLFWDKYETKVAEVAESVNDSYLKVNHQEDGIKSYGRVVDLMLGYYRDRGELSDN